MSSKRIAKVPHLHLPGLLEKPSPGLNLYTDLLAPFQELGDCQSSPPPDVTISYNESDIYKWNITLLGPQGSVYEGGSFNLTLTLPHDYPFKAPVVNFTTRIYHPNVTNDSMGNICLAMLKSENWKPASRIKGVLEAVRNLLIEPQPDDPLESRIADEYKTDRPTFEKQAAHYVERYAKGDGKK